MTSTGSVPGPRCRFRSISRDLEQGQNPGGFSAGRGMRDQEFVLAIEEGQDTPKFTGRERGVGSRLFAGGLNKGRPQPASVQGPNVG